MTSSAAAVATREMRLLLCAARLELAAAHRAEIAALLTGRLDWTDLSSLAQHHGMAPLLLRHLRDYAALIPPDAFAQLLQDDRRNGLDSLRLTGELLQILKLFEAENIPAVAYKGAVLAVQVYGNLALRQVGDLDIFIRKADLPKARTLLLARGYVPRDPLTEANQEFRWAQRYSEDFYAQNGVSVDLHWRFTNGDIRFPLTIEELRPRLTPIRIGSAQTSTLSREDALLVLCVHGAKHRWDRLEWICGVAELLRASAAPVRWEEVSRRAAAFGGTRMLLLGVLIAHEVLGAPVPEPVLTEARRQRWIPILASDVRNRLLAGPAHRAAGFAGMLSRNLFQLPLQDRAADRARYLIYRLTTPNRPDAWRTMSVGRFSVPVHVLVWPVRLVARLAARATEGLWRGHRFRRPT